MPGNELGDRVHNFFAHENSSQGQHQSQAVEENWPVANDNYWVGSQRQIDVLNSNRKTNNLQNSDTDRGTHNYPLHASHSLNSTQATQRADFTKSQSQSKQSNLNGSMYGGQFQYTRQNEANFLAVDTDSDQRHLLNSRGLSILESEQGSGLEHQAKTSVRSETSVSPASFDLFGGQQQMSHHQSSMLQSLQRQQSGTHDMQQLQQQLMFRKMQEFERQELRQQDSRQQNLINQNFPFAKQASGSQLSTQVNGTPSSDTFHPWVTDFGNTSWLHRGSPTMQESLNISPPNLGQAQHTVDLVPQLVDQSLYGVPISSSRGLTINQLSQMVTDKPSMLQMSAFGNSLERNQLGDQVSMQDGTSVSRQRFHNENMLGHISGQDLNAGLNMKNLQQVNLMQRNAPQQDNRGRQDQNMVSLQQVILMQQNAAQQDVVGRHDQAISREISHEKPTRQYSSSQNEVALDPTEEKILFGSDDNIWDAFGKSSDVSGEAGDLFNNAGLLNEFPSIQSGSWSALMQSAVAETSSSDTVPQEEWSGLMFNSTEVPSTNNHPSLYNVIGKQEAYQNVTGFDQFGHKFQGKPGQMFQAEMSQRLVQSTEEANQWSNGGPMPRSAAEGNQMYRNLSQHSLDEEKNSKRIPTPWKPEQSETKQEPNSWNAFAAVASGADRMVNIHESEHSLQNSPSNQTRLMHGEVVYGSSLVKSNFLPGSTAELGPVNYSMGSNQVTKGGLSLNDAASMPNSSATAVDEENCHFDPNTYVLNQWKNADPSIKSRGEGLGRMLHQGNEDNRVLDSLNSCGKEEVTAQRENSDLKGNSNESHFSNLLQQIPSGLRETRLSDASDSRHQPTCKQKSSNQRKASGPRKFQYHPMGNLDEDVEPSHGLKQPTHALAMSQQNIHLGRSKFFDQGQSSDLQRDTRGPDEGPYRINLPGYAPNNSIPFNRTVDAYEPNKTSSSQHMLELLHKVDQSMNRSSMMHFNSSEHNVSSQLPETENSDCSVDRLHRNQSSASQGFGLHLGPPSQRMQISEHSSPPQTVPHTIDSSHSSLSAAEMREKGRQMDPASIRSSPFSTVQFQTESKIGRSGIQGQVGNRNTLNKIPENFPSALNSEVAYSRSNLHNQQITRARGQISVNQYTDLSFDRNASHSIQKGSKVTSSPDASGSTPHDNRTSLGGASKQNSNSDPQERGSTDTVSAKDHLPASQPVMPGNFQQGLSAQMFMWNNVPTRHHTLDSQFLKASSQFSESAQPNTVESSTSAPQTTSDHHVRKGGNLSSEFSAIPMNSAAVSGEEQRLNGRQVTLVDGDPFQKMNEANGNVNSVKHPLDDSPANSSTQKDVETFGRSLKPNSFSHQNYSLNQMPAMKDSDTDPNNRVAKRMRVPDNGPGVRKVSSEAGRANEQSATIGDSLGSNAAGTSGDSKTLRFSRPAAILEEDNTFQHGNVASQDMLAIGQDVSKSNSHSSQMSSSLFNQHGTFKNEEMLQTYDANTVTTLRTAGAPLFLGKSSSSFHTLDSMDGTTQVGGRQQSSIPSSIAALHATSPELLHLNVSGQHMVTVKPKKRKGATSVLHPWHREVSQGSQMLHTLSGAEIDWGKAANRLSEKVEDINLIEDGQPVLKSRRRLILTTQLMQQLLRPPPPAVISADASSDYESVAYSVSRIALGDACGAVSHSSVSDKHCGGEDLLFVEGKPSEGSGDQRFEKVMKEIMGKARKLEDEFFRLDKSASILDLRIECQDLEKFSVINRFAKFHGRGQTDSAETSTSTQKSCLQRYITPLPMPRILPDGVQCLSL